MIWLAVGGMALVLVIVLVIGAWRRKIEVVSLAPPSISGSLAPVELAGRPPSAERAQGVGGEPDAAVMGEINAGRLIEAIKLYRQGTGLGLKEAKEAVEALRDGRPVRRAPGRSIDVGAAVMAEINAGRLIEAIRLYRQGTGLGLKEAKENVEALRDGRPPPHPY